MTTQQPGASSPTSPIGLVVGAILCAAVGAGTAVLMQAEPTIVPASNPPATAAQNDLVTRIEQIEARLAAGIAETAPAPANAADRTPARLADEAMDQRMTDVEQAVRAIQEELAKAQSLAQANRQARPRPTRPTRSPAELERERVRKVAAAQQAILDPTSTEQQKLKAWSNLRFHENAWDDALVSQMTHIGLTASDAATRADVWRQADGRSNHPALATALLQALQTDPEQEVREEAAETLVEYAGRQPSLLPTIQNLLANERDEDVREYLKRAVSQAQRKK